MANLSAEEVKRTVSADFKRKGIMHKDAAAKLGMKAQTVANILSDKKSYFPPVTARKFGEAFGYDMDFLMTGRTDEEGQREQEIPRPSGLGRSEAPMVAHCADSDMEMANMKLSLAYGFMKRALMAWGNAHATNVIVGCGELLDNRGMLEVMDIVSRIEDALSCLENPVQEEAE